ncbi:hypothetical protein [Salmonella enterica]|nr:hypothetical protein [Salmonella enterica]
MSVFDMVGNLYGGLFYGFIVWGKVRVKHPVYKIIGFLNIEL